MAQYPDPAYIVRMVPLRHMHYVWWVLENQRHYVHGFRYCAINVRAKGSRRIAPQPISKPFCLAYTQRTFCEALYSPQSFQSHPAHFEFSYFPLRYTLVPSFVSSQPYPQHTIHPSSNEYAVLRIHNSVRFSNVCCVATRQPWLPSPMFYINLYSSIWLHVSPSRTPPAPPSTPGTPCRTHSGCLMSHYVYTSVHRFKSECRRIGHKGVS